MQLSLVFLAAAPAAAANSVYQGYAETAFQTLQSWYDEGTGLWDTCGWWNGANCMTVIADLAAIDDSILSTATSIFAHTFTAAPASNPKSQIVKISVGDRVDTVYGPPSEAKAARGINDLRDFTSRAAEDPNPDGFVDSCYDDNGWWALAWIGAYDLTQNSDYINTAAGIFDQMTGGGPTNCSNGGIIWCATGSYYVNAIANELYLSVGAHLANRVSSNASYYTTAAQNQWNWFKNSGMINSENLINDGLNSDCSNDGTRTVWTYNMGVILGALVELNKASADSSLISTANDLANAAIANLTDSNHILHDVCEPNCAPDATQFKGIFMRNLAALQAVSPSDSYAQVIQANADSIWNNDRDTSNNQLSIDWAGPFVSSANASTHSSAMDALVAAIALS